MLPRRPLLSVLGVSLDDLSLAQTPLMLLWCSRAWRFSLRLLPFPSERSSWSWCHTGTPHLLLCFLTDSPASASREIAFFFPEFNEQLWYQREEPRLRCGRVFYNAEERVHCVLGDGDTELT